MKKTALSLVLALAASTAAADATKVESGVAAGSVVEATGSAMSQDDKIVGGVITVIALWAMTEIANTDGTEVVEEDTDTDTTTTTST